MRKISTKIMFSMSILNFCLVVLTLKTEAQTSDWQWAKRAGGSAADYTNSVAADASGNIYITGYFESPSILFGSTTLINANTNHTPDIFITKYGPNGNVLWAKRAGGDDNDIATSISTNAAGQVYVAGRFNSPSITFGATTLINSGSSDMFIAKYDSNGVVLWAKGATGSSYDIANAVSADAYGNIYVAGMCGGSTITFDSITLNNIAGNDSYIVKYNSSGPVVWAKTIAGNGSSSNSVTSIAASPTASGEVYVTGEFATSATFGAITLDGLYDIYVAKYDSSGNVQWAKKAGGSSTKEDRGNSITADVFGNVYVTGFFYSLSVSFGATTLTNAGNADVFIAKYDNNGEVLWAKSAGNTFADVAYAITSDLSGNTFIAGDFSSSSVAFDSYTLNNINPSSDDMFLVKYDVNGNVLWAKSAGGNNTDQAHALCVDDSDNVYVTGGFQSSSITYGSTTLTNAGFDFDAFIAKLKTTLTGIEHIENNDGMIIYPNPNGGKFTIKNNNIHSIEIYNLLGGKIYSAISNGQQEKYDIDIAHSPKGIYIIKIYDGRNFFTEKIEFIF